MSGRTVLGGLAAVVVVGLISPVAGAVLLGLLALGFFLLRPPESGAAPGREDEVGMQALAGRVARLERELAELRLLVAEPPVAAAPAAAPPPRPQPPAAQPVRPTASAPSEPRTRPQPARPRRELDLSKL
ncbi:MAG: hypothetical protein ACRDPP_10565, partial [Gaiellaceae bacterium]